MLFSAILFTGKVNTFADTEIHIIMIQVKCNADS